MTALVHLDLTARAIEACLSSLALHSRRVYKSRIERYLSWSKETAFDREHVQRYLRSLELQSASAQVRNQALAALKKLAIEAAELGWIDHAQALQIARIKAKRITGTRTGRWLSLEQSAALLGAVDRTTLQGKRDACVIALLLGCGLRRSEACALELQQFVERGGRIIIENLKGKGGRIRSVAVPSWAALLIEDWRERLSDGTMLLRSIRSDGTINGSLSPAAIRDIVKHYGQLITIDDLNPHDLRRTCAKLARLGGAPLETVQHTLGHASLKTTQLYLSTGEEANAGDFFTL